MGERKGNNSPANCHASAFPNSRLPCKRANSCNYVQTKVSPGVVCTSGKLRHTSITPVWSRYHCLVFRVKSISAGEDITAVADFPHNTTVLRLMWKYNFPNSYQNPWDWNIVLGVRCLKMFVNMGLLQTGNFLLSSPPKYSTCLLVLSSFIFSSKESLRGTCRTKVHLPGTCNKL